MEVNETIECLRAEREKLNAVIAALERLKTATSEAYGLSKKRRGRKSMCLDERKLVSIRMKAYWARRHEQETSASSDAKGLAVGAT